MASSYLKYRQRLESQREETQPTVRIKHKIKAEMKIIKAKVLKQRSYSVCILSSTTLRRNARNMKLIDMLFIPTTASTIADIWTANNKGFLCVTVHCISRSTLARNKVTIACKRIRGKHTFDATVTDNASDFAKAFKIYQPISQKPSPLKQMISFTLPLHYRCVSHTINLIYLTSNADTKAVYRSSIAKCAALWTKASRSTVASEHVEENSHKKLLVPSSTRGNSFYEAISRITEIPMNVQNTALDILQADDCCYVTLLPTLKVLMTRMLALKDALSRITAGLPDVVVKMKVGELLTAEWHTIVHAEEPASLFMPSAIHDEKDFFAFETEPEESYVADKEVMDYVSTPVEQLFSLGSLVLTLRRDRLSDKRFEKIVLIRYNHCFTFEHWDQV
uniref:Uncharacterized protein n=1 Tax=Erpetoichthys calabaricus TaxID=27687 RepID=A0A8C4RZ51_ERPCA